MRNHCYMGTSTHGDFQEALSQAIAKAKEAIPSDFVKWKVELISGENGGVVLKNDLTVTIQISEAN